MFVTKKSTSIEGCQELAPGRLNELHHLLADEPARQLAGWFKGLSEANRVKIGYALTCHEELCVHDISEVVGISVANASHHLRLMKMLGLTKTRKIGTTVFYSLADDHVRNILILGMDHMEEGT
jgi:ArsR family transcriptional regulator, lead/cadmium/zinc/bismuth-responsive transcriptional repressor